MDSEYLGFVTTRVDGSREVTHLARAVSTACCQVVLPRLESATSKDEITAMTRTARTPTRTRSRLCGRS
jgi:hypothetical protein